MNRPSLTRVADAVLVAIIYTLALLLVAPVWLLDAWRARQ